MFHRCRGIFLDNDRRGRRLRFVMCFVPIVGRDIVVGCRGWQWRWYDDDDDIGSFRDGSGGVFSMGVFDLVVDVVECHVVCRRDCGQGSNRSGTDRSSSRSKSSSGCCSRSGGGNARRNHRGATIATTRTTVRCCRRDDDDRVRFRFLAARCVRSVPPPLAPPPPRTLSKLFLGQNDERPISFCRFIILLFFFGCFFVVCISTSLFLSLLLFLLLFSFHPIRTKGIGIQTTRQGLETPMDAVLPVDVNEDVSEGDVISQGGRRVDVRDDGEGRGHVEQQGRVRRDSEEEGSEAVRAGRWRVRSGGRRRCDCVGGRIRK
mmetsp:Transcript_7111/g.15281  ORF Transcript_7111/g.15281 Transcript_7111/m.15281 type:complete len:318 (+) Transcript_7111:151-1104(+)